MERSADRDQDKNGSRSRKNIDFDLEVPGQEKRDPDQNNAVELNCALCG